MKRLALPLSGLLANVIILVALLQAAAHLGLYLIADYRQEIEDLASERLGTRIRIDAIQGRWTGLQAELMLRGVSVGQTEESEALRFDTVVLQSHLFDLWHYPERPLYKVVLDGLVIHMIRTTSGEIQLAGLKSVNNTQGSPVIPGRLELRNAGLIWEDQMLDLPRKNIQVPSLQLIQHKEGMLVGARLKNPLGQVELAADIRGDIQGDHWSGELYLKTEGLDVARVLGGYVPQDYRLKTLHLDTHIWTRWQGARPVEARGDIQLANLQLEHQKGQKKTFPLSSLGGLFLLKNTGDHWQLRLKEFNFRPTKDPGDDWPESELALDYHQQGPARVLLAASYLRIQDLARLLDFDTLPVPKDIRKALKKTSPRGELLDTHLVAHLDTDRPEWRLNSQFRDLGISAWEDLPGIQHLTGTISGNHRGARLHLATEDAIIDLKGLFRAPLGFDSLKGDLLWQSDDSGWVLSTDEIIANNKDIETRSRLLLRAQKGQSLFIDLQTDFGQGTARYAGRYYPTGIMDKGLVKWLDEGIISGHVPGGSCVLRGPLADFPFDKTHNGHFEVSFDASDLRLNYQQGWPVLDNINARVRFHNNSLGIQLAVADLYQSKVNKATARIETLDPTSPVEIRGQVTGPFSDTLKLLSESPLKEDFGDMVTGLTATGTTKLDLAIRIPIEEGQEYGLNSTLTLNNNQLRLDDWDLTLSEARGEIHFDLDGVRAEQVTLKALNTPIKLKIIPKGSGTLIRTRGQFDIADISQQFPRLAAARMDGRSDFRIRLFIPGTAGSTSASLRLDIDSLLKGIRIDLPQPLTKEASTEAALHIHSLLDHDNPIFFARYFDLGAAIVDPRDGRSQIIFGIGRPKLPEKKVISIKGKLDQLDADPWMALFDQSESVAAPDIETDLAITQLDIAGFSLTNGHYQIGRGQHAFSGKISSDQVAGEFVVPLDLKSAPIRLNLDRLHLTTPSEKPEDEDGEGEQEDYINPNSIPEIEAVCRQLLINDADLGALKVSLKRIEDGLDIREISLDSDLLKLQTNGDWRYLAQGPQTWISGTLEAANLGDLLGKLGLQSQIKDGKTSSQFDLKWPGSPHDLSLDKATGTVDLSVEDGQFLELEPGVARVIGLLNITALQRRLRLDFSDIFGKGLAFDSITGHFQLASGDSYTNNLSIRGPSSRIDISGRTGLAAHDLDQLVSVIPRLDSTLTLASTLAGGPAAGLAVFLAQKIAGEQIDKFNRFQYSVIGPWDAPEITQLDTGGPLSKLLQPFLGKKDQSEGQAQEPETEPGQFHQEEQ